MPTIEENDNLGQSDDDEEQDRVTADEDVQTECK